MAGRQKSSKPSMKDVAVRSGVSTATVSHVINGTRYVSEEVSKKVHEAMRELNYFPNSIARSLRSKQSYLVGLIIPVKAYSDMANLFFMTVAQGVESILTKNGYKMILCNSYEDLQVERELIQMFNAQLVDGVILAPVAKEFEQISDVVTEQYPIVLIDRNIRSFQGDCVRADQFKGSSEAIRHLLQKGHTSIGFISSKNDISSSQERFEGYCWALQEAGFESVERLIKTGDVTFEEGYRLASELVESKQVTALFIANNTMTAGALSYLQEKGMAIPDQIAVIGFDDYEVLRVLNPPLTTVRQPAYGMGQKAAQVLLDRIRSTENSDGSEYVMDTELIIRKST
ncbi:LacI family DNA-binding transcriptional regulator [Bacillus sp. 1P06AnD]|uniref:LacI family DNA-binding transcriptional regulator n=1 Tax=Bacillus sp. 1P06AnD TaxID=3132208 RepID=UPI0039A34912